MDDPKLMPGMVLFSTIYLSAIILLVIVLLRMLMALLTVYTLASSISGGYPFPPAGIVLGWVLSSFSLGPLLYFALRHSGGLVPWLRERLRHKAAVPPEVTPRVTEVVRQASLPAAALPGAGDDAETVQARV